MEYGERMAASRILGLCSLIDLCLVKSVRFVVTILDVHHSNYYVLLLL